MTRILDLEETRPLVGEMVHLQTQAADVGIDLTIGDVFRLSEGGSLDFGGSEHVPAGLERIDPALRSDEDDYGWWELDEGSYVVRYNESLKLDGGHLAHVYPLERLLMAGARHAAFVVDAPRDPLQTLLGVGEAGCSLKENARISRLVATRL